MFLAADSLWKHRWWFVSILYLQLLQVPLLSSIVVVLALLAITRFGVDVLRHAGFGQTSLGAAFVFGAGTFVVIGQLLLHIGVPATFVHSGILLTFLLFSFFSHLKVLHRGKVDAMAPEFGFTVGIAALAFGIRHPWTIPFALSVVVLDWLGRNNSRRRICQLLLMAAVLGGWLISFYLRFESWWYLYYTRSDAGFFESISWIGSEWGVTTRPGMVNESIAGYHWLSYVFFGGLSHVAGLPPWDALMKLGVPLLLVVFASLFSGSPMLTRELRNSKWTWLCTLLVVVTSSVTRVDSSFFGLLAGLCLLSLVLVQQRELLNGFFPAMVLMMSMVTLMLSKAPVAVVLASIVIVISVTSTRRRSMTKWLPSVALVVGGSATYLILFRGETTESYMRVLGGRTFSQLLIESFVVPPASLLTVTLLLLIFSCRKQGETRRVFLGPVSLLGATAIAVVAMSIAHLVLFNGDLLFTPSHFYLSIAACWVVLNWQFDLPRVFQTQKLARVIGVTVATGLAGFAWPVFSNRLNQTLGISAVLGDLGWESFQKIPPFIPVWLLLLTMALSRRASWFTDFRKTAVITACLGLTIGIQLDSARRFATYGTSIYTSSQNNDPAFPTNHLRAVGKYIRLNTDKDLILATNDFCCFGDAWWQPLEEGTDESVSGTKPWRWGGDNHLVVAESRRRILIQGLAFQLGAGIPTSEQIGRVSLSLEFANQPSAEAVQRLQRARVSGFVVNLDLTEHRDWSEFAIKRFQSGNYVYLELGAN